MSDIVIKHFDGKPVMRYEGKPATFPELREIYRASPLMLELFDILDRPAVNPEDAKYVGVVYFAQAINGGPVKIGHSRDTRGRLKSLQSGNGERLLLLGTIPGGADKEKALHVKFAAFRLHGEWFQPSKKLLKFIESTNRTSSKRGETCQAS